MKRRFRLRRSTDFERVRRSGKSYAHPFVVVIKHPNDLAFSRFGFSAGRSVGNAVQRNRAKRRIREIVRLRMSKIQPGWDLVFLARKSIHEAGFDELRAAIDLLLERAGVVERNYVN